MRMQSIGRNGKSAVATLDGSSRKKKKTKFTKTVSHELVPCLCLCDACCFARLLNPVLAVLNIPEVTSSSFSTGADSTASFRWTFTGSDEEGANCKGGGGGGGANLGGGNGGGGGGGRDGERSREVGGAGSKEGLMSFSLLVNLHASVMSTPFGSDDSRFKILRRFLPFFGAGRHCGRIVNGDGYF